MYDVTNRSTFDHLTHWMVEVDTYSTKSDAVKMLVGNKIDMGGLNFSPILFSWLFLKLLIIICFRRIEKLHVKKD